MNTSKKKKKKDANKLHKDISSAAMVDISICLHSFCVYYTWLSIWMDAEQIGQSFKQTPLLIE